MTHSDCPVSSFRSVVLQYSVFRTELKKSKSQNSILIDTRQSLKSVAHRPSVSHIQLVLSTPLRCSSLAPWQHRTRHLQKCCTASTPKATLNSPFRHALLAHTHTHTHPHHAPFRTSTRGPTCHIESKLLILRLSPISLPLFAVAGGLLHCRGAPGCRGWLVGRRDARRRPWSVPQGLRVAHAAGTAQATQPLRSLTPTNRLSFHAGRYAGPNGEWS